ncbi:MAG: hypothetical protein AAFX78_11810 [Cyanobacteria bacterium J06638_20]
MSKTLTITLPDALEQALVRTAAQANRSTEEVVVQLLAQTLMRLEASASVPDLASDPLLQLAGCIESDIPDLADNHDYYIGRALHNEMHGDDE